MFLIGCRTGAIPLLWNPTGSPSSPDRRHRAGPEKPTTENGDREKNGLVLAASHGYREATCLPIAWFQLRTGECTPPKYIRILFLTYSPPCSMV